MQAGLGEESLRDSIMAPNHNKMLSCRELVTCHLSNKYFLFICLYSSECSLSGITLLPVNLKCINVFSVWVVMDVLVCVRFAPTVPL